jgi:uncharacterized protein
MKTQLRKNELHEFSFDGRQFVLCVPTSSVFAIDDLAKSLLDSVNGTSEHAIVEKLGPRYGEGKVRHAMLEMEQAGLILGVEGHVAAVPPEVSTQVTNMAIYITDRCNLRCTYCYEAGRCHREQRGHMDRDTARRAADFLLAQAGPGKACTVQFFGGEPLLNFTLLKFIVRYCAEKGRELDKRVAFTIDTNGTLLHGEIVDFCSAEGISVAVSIDGPKRVHDRARIFPGGKGSYDVVVKHCGSLLGRMREKVGARATLTKENVRFKDTVAHLLELGFERILIDCDGGSTGTWDDAEMEILKDEFEKATCYFLELLRQDRFFSFGNILSLLPLIHKRERKRYHCGAGISYVAVAPDGTLYPCHRLVGISRFSMGNLSQGVSRSLSEEILANAVESKDSCTRCWARYLCGGGCLYRSFIATGNPFTPDPVWCDLTRHVLTLAMAVYCEMRQKRKPAELSDNSSLRKTSSGSSERIRPGRKEFTEAGE